MKISVAVFTFVSMAVLIIQSCEYEPSGIYDRAVNEHISPPVIEPLYLDIETDTIYLYSNRAVNFSFRSSNQAIKTIKFIIDETERYTVDSDNGVFNLYYEEFSSGMHTMVIQIYTSSGTGSIAEILGQEGYVFTKSWTLIADKSYKNETVATVENGYLKLKWPRYQAPDFNEYIVYRYHGMFEETEIKRLISLAYTDSTYVGEGGHYSVKVSTRDNGLVSWGDLYLDKDFPQLILMPSEREPYRLRWTKPTYYNAIDTVTLKESFNFYDPFTTIKNSQDPGDTIQEITGGSFGDRVDFIFKLVPGQGNIFYNSANQRDYQSEAQFLLGMSFQEDPLDWCNKILQVSQDEFIYVAGGSSVKRFSVSGRRVVEESGCPDSDCSNCNLGGLVPSSSGRNMVYGENCQTSKIVLLNSGNFKSSLTADLSRFICPNYYPEVRIADNSTGTVNNCMGGFYVIDFNADTALALYKKEGFSGGTALDISSSGEYILLMYDSLRLVRFSGSEFFNIWSRSYNEPAYSLIGFDGSDHSQLYFWDGQTFSVRRCSNFAAVNEFPLTDTYILNIDFYNREILSYSPGHLYIRSYTTGDLLTDIPVKMIITGADNECFLINHAIVSKRGLIYYVNQN